MRSIFKLLSRISAPALVLQSSALLLMSDVIFAVNMTQIGGPFSGRHLNQPSTSGLQSSVSLTTGTGGQKGDAGGGTWSHLRSSTIIFFRPRLFEVIIIAGNSKPSFHKHC